MSPRFVSRSLSAALALALASSMSLGAQAARRPAPAAGSPEAVVVAYGAAMRDGDWNRAATLMHPAGLKQFRGLLAPVIDADSTHEILQQMFGTSDPAVLRAASDAAFFGKFMQALVKQAPGLGSALGGAALEPVGHVDEGRDTTHVVARMTISMEGITISKVQAITLQRSGTAWLVSLSGDLEGLAQAMRRGRS